MQVVVAGKADLGAARPAGLIDEGGRAGRRGLVELQPQVAGSGRGVVMGEQHGVGLDREPVGRVGLRVDAYERRGIDGPDAGEPDPCGPVEHQRRFLVGHPGDPAFVRREEGPGLVLERGDPAVLALPRPGRGIGDDVALALGGFVRRRGAAPACDCKLDEGVQLPQRLVVGDVLLRLRRQDVGKPEIGGRVQDASSPSCPADMISIVADGVDRSAERSRVAAPHVLCQEVGQGPTRRCIPICGPPEPGT